MQRKSLLIETQAENTDASFSWFFFFFGTTNVRTRRIRATFLAVGVHCLFPRIAHECYSDTHGRYAETGGDQHQHERSSANCRRETMDLTAYPDPSA